MSDHGGDHGEKKKKSHGGGHGGGGYHPPHEEHEGAPEWLISFADFVMLCMGFFVILFALNVQPKGGNPGGGGEQNEGVSAQPDMIDFAIAVREAFNNPVDINSTDPLDRPLADRKKAREAGAGDAPDDGTRGNKREVTTPRPSDYHGKGTKVDFAQRSVMLDEAALRIVTEFAAKNRGMKVVLEIRGHASQSEAFRKPEEAMILSQDRAMAVARALVTAGIEWWRLRLMSCGDHDRVIPNPNEETDSRNARAEILVTGEVAAPPTPVAPPTAADGER